VLEIAATAWTALVVASQARIGVENRPDAVSAIGQWIVRLPLVEKERSPFFGHGRIDRLGMRRSPAKHSYSNRQDRQKYKWNIPREIGPIHGNTSALDAYLATT